jgi:hypothetical protein
MVYIKYKYRMLAGEVCMHLAGKRYIRVLDKKERLTIVKTIS